MKEGKHLEEAKWKMISDLHLKCERERVRKIEWACVMLVTYLETFTWVDGDRQEDSRAGKKPNGKPSQILEGLRKLDKVHWEKAAKNLDMETMIELWNVRNLLVHRVGKADHRFRIAHPGVDLDEHGRVVLSSEALERYSGATAIFVDEIESYLARRVARLTIRGGTEGLFAAEVGTSCSRPI